MPRIFYDLVYSPDNGKWYVQVFKWEGRAIDLFETKLFNNYLAEAVNY